MKLSISNANVFYGKNHILHDINLELDAGIYGLIGENGAGKTTLINLIIGLLNAEKGSITWNNEDIHKLGRRYYDDVGYLPQFPLLYGDFYPEEFLLYMSKLKGLNKKEALNRTKELLEFVGLENEKKKKIEAFSGGMRQRLGIAQALINNPKLLILDEPTAGLDPSERIRFRNIITELSKDKIIILATHIISDIENISSEILFLNKGRIIKKDTVDILINEILDNVYIAEVTEELYNTLDKRLLSNVSNIGELYKVRGFIKEIEGAKQVEPNLEDVFLYYVVNTKEGERENVKE